MNNPELIEFECTNNLSQYTDSMLFDSGEEIATGLFRYKDKEVEISLRICGQVAVDYKGETYHTPSEFPDELVERIKAHPNDWMYYSPSGEDTDDAEGDVYVGLNNWFEYIFDGDGCVYEEDLSKATKEDILQDMIYLARQFFGLDLIEKAV